MPTRLEESLERDIGRIRQQVLAMSGLAEQALRDCVQALVEGNLQRAYAVILRDQYIDEKEKGIDRLCLEFLVRQQPVGAHLHLAYSTIKVNLELERVGDYAESVARQIVRLGSHPIVPDPIRQRIVEMADLAIPMLHDSVEAFIRQDPELARKVILSEPAVAITLRTSASRGGRGRKRQRRRSRRAIARILTGHHDGLAGSHPTGSPSSSSR